ncbi:hypothetical protein FSP39_013362 [Pinctada imbricata]|uniref:PH domain-containing protein n=1 Tax=Pinctada imbricata TaxID=66713 RepID=A0AA88YNN4_PINIB|nr:hypothetical protein FSP39_013362 [Pinctada imbricata]
MVCRGKLYIFKSQSPEEHAYLNIILSNCTITYLSDQDKRFKKLFVFKITRNRRKSVYLNAADKNELSRWLQVLQMESNKVQGDADSVDSGQSLSDYTNTNVTYSSGPVKFSLGTTSSDNWQSDSEGVCHSESSRRFSLPNGFDGGNDSGYVPSADESEYKENVGGKTHVGFPRNDLPDIDPALKHVWQQDKNYLLNMVRAKLRRSRKRNDSEPFTNQPLPGPNNEGLIVMADQPEVTSTRKKQKICGKIKMEGKEGKTTNLERVKSMSLPCHARRVSDAYRDVPKVFLRGYDDSYPYNTNPISRKLVMRPRWSHLMGSGSRDVRRTMSFNGANPASASGVKTLNPPAVESPMSSPSSRKRHKPLAVKKLAARDLENCAIAGYMERRSFSGQWIRYWYVLKDGTMFCYLTPDDNVTVDILNLQGYKIAYLVDKFRGKRFVLQLSHQEYSSIYMSLESREKMTEWLECLQLATGVPPSPHGVLDDQDSPEQLSDKSSDPDYHDKCQSVKQKLLAEMLRQKHELEKKQATRQKRQSGDGGNPEMMTEEDQIRDVTRLRQRRMSAQIKMDTIQKQLQSAASSGKKFPFKFGAKKKVPENKNEHLQEQLKELSVKLEEIDRNLSSHTKPTEFLDMNQNKRQVAIEETRTSHDFYDNNGDVNKGNGKNIKASVQKLKTKTFSKGAKSKNRKSTEFQNGHVSTLESGPLNSSAHELKLDLTNCRLQDDDVDSENGSESHRSDSFTDLTKNKSPTSSVDDNVFSDQNENGGVIQNPRRKAVSNPVTPRKEVDPNVLAEIDVSFTSMFLCPRNQRFGGI